MISRHENVLVVGAGGIGSEVLKNLAMSGFKKITVIDLDTIDVSNLNRQFLFRKEHVGQSKADVSARAVTSMLPDCNITAIHDTVMNPNFNRDYFSQFTVVLNALDNRAARSHVNRLCLAANVPLVESGSAGYFGQVTVIKKGVTECYDCLPKAAQKTFPGCTIRNTPSEPVHCIVWAKHLFNQLFGESDPDEDVSPDTHDPEAAGSAGDAALLEADAERRSTRQWAAETGYDVAKVFNKLFGEDIKYLLSMSNLWKSRRPPTPCFWNDVESSSVPCKSQVTPDIAQCRQMFAAAMKDLAASVTGTEPPQNLVWDKDDQVALEFVVAASNIRSSIFGIPLKSVFEVKSIAGNIIPAIATTNAIIAGMVVIEAMKLINNDFASCHTTYLNRFPNWRGRLFVNAPLEPPSAKCYVCADRPEVTVRFNCELMTCKAFATSVLCAELGMVAPDVEIDDGKGTIIISSEEGETASNDDKPLSVFGVANGTRLKCDDFLQSFELVVNVENAVELTNDAGEPADFVVVRSTEPAESLSALKTPVKTQLNNSLADQPSGKKRKLSSAS